MIELISNLEVSINQRLDQLEMLTLDSTHFSSFIRDDEKKRAIVRGFRLIKSSQKLRVAEQARILSQIVKMPKKMSKNQMIVIQNMIVNCINQYLNSEYVAKKTGQPNDIIDAFTFYYQKINALSKIKQMKVIKNCELLNQINFMSDNLGFFVSNVQTSINYVYENEKAKFFQLLKTQNRSISPEKRGYEEEQQYQKFDRTGKSKNRTKRQMQIYCFQLSQLLNLEHIYLDYFYFSSLEIDKRKRVLQSNFMKRNVYIRKIIQGYQKNHQSYKQKELSKSKKQA